MLSMRVMNVELSGLTSFFLWFHNLARPWDKRMSCLAPHSALSLAYLILVEIK